MNQDRSPFRYLRHHAWDVARGPFALFVIVSVGLVFIMSRMFRGETPPPIDDLLGGIVAATMLIAVLMASGGVAGVDIKQGYYRALFSKPFAPWWYYLQRWVLGGVAFLLTPIWLGLCLQVAFDRGTGLSWELLGTAGLGFLLIGGTVFLFSTVTSRDWLVAFMVYFLEMQLHNARQVFERIGRDTPAVMDAVLTILPPFHLLTPNSGLPEGMALWHVAAYGVGLVTAAMLILAIRPLGSGGRA
jgi:hypothetical protein